MLKIIQQILMEAQNFSANRRTEFSGAIEKMGYSYWGKFLPLEMEKRVRAPLSSSGGQDRAKIIKCKSPPSSRQHMIF
jgi:hypothetical protein